MAEAAPDKLLRKYQCQTIERVFLILSRKQEEEGQSSETVQENFEDRESDIELTVFENSDNKVLQICNESNIRGFIDFLCLCFRILLKILAMKSPENIQTIKV